MIDRDRLREALAASDEFNGEEPWEHYVTIREAARLVADPDTLVIERDVAGNWPLHILNAIGEKAKVDPWLIQSIIEDALLAYQTGDTG